MGNLKSPFNLTCVYLDCKRWEGGNPSRRRRTCNQGLESNPGAPGSESRVLTTLEEIYLVRRRKFTFFNTRSVLGSDLHPFLTNLCVHPLNAFSSILHPSIEVYRAHVLRASLLPGVTVTQPVVGFLHLWTNATVISSALIESWKVLLNMTVKQQHYCSFTLFKI